VRLNKTGFSNIPGSMTIAKVTEKSLGRRGSRSFKRTRTKGAAWYHHWTQQPPHLVACTASSSSL
jgi:hypothetical protein